MTDSLPPPNPASPKRSPQPSSPVRSFLVLVFRLLLLGVGGGVAWLAGMAIAQVHPAQVEQPPLFENVLRYSGALINWARQFPQSVSLAPEDANEP